MAHMIPGKSLITKLGLKPHTRVYLYHCPFALRAMLAFPSPQFEEVTILSTPADFMLIFVSHLSELKAILPELLQNLTPKGILWIAWPAKTSGKPTDLSERTIRSLGQTIGLADVKVTAIDIFWSGIKFILKPVSPESH